MKQVYYALVAILLLNFGCKKEDSTTSPEDSNVGKSITYNGYTYHTVTIGAQEWTVENLRTTSYNDGTPISKEPDSTVWSTLETSAYCAYRNNEANVKSYGYLYNWYAINSGKLAPTFDGWRVPTHADWTKLTNYLGGEDSSGTKLKAKSEWNTGNGIDQYGFNSLPGGKRGTRGDFSDLGYSGHWWSSTAYGSTTAYNRGMNSISTSVYSYDYNKKYGFSVRLVRDK